ncbi:MAG: orotidine-5'-phosphate decarboxylase [Candidatus Moranbacteria bacterium]|nr:orotidine-5'-phosphate decarboxylase [Candidatus Moranbacteria bacterium]
MKPEDVKIVFPLDVPTVEQGRALMTEVGDHIDIPKVGLELIHSIGTPAAVALPKEFGKLPFVDAKLNDIPNTVKGAAKGITSHRVHAFNVMASGGQPMMEAAMEGASEAAKELGIPRPKVIAVTILTSLKLSHLVELGICPAKLLLLNEEEQRAVIHIMTLGEMQAAITEIVMRWAKVSVDAGVDIILSSPWESAAIHAKWPNIDLYSPGIRLPDSPPDDQGRTLTPGQAVKNGVKYLVIGRPIRNPEGGRTRKQVISEIRADIAQALMGQKIP